MGLQYGDDISGKKCPGCSGPLVGDLVYREGAYHHRKCWEKMEAGRAHKAQQRADEIMRRYGFEPVPHSA